MEVIERAEVKGVTSFIVVPSIVCKYDQAIIRSGTFEADNEDQMVKALVSGTNCPWCCRSM